MHNQKQFVCFGISFEKVDILEFRTRTFCKNMGAICIDTITEVKVPYSEDHSVLEYYKGLMENAVIYGKNIGNISEIEI